VLLLLLLLPLEVVSLEPADRSHLFISFPGLGVLLRSISNRSLVCFIEGSKLDGRRGGNRVVS
jgi:hypothetical protein